MNYWLIWDALGALERTEAVSGVPLGIDPNSETSSKEASRRFVRPWVHRWSAERVARLRLSLAYYLSRTDILDDNVLASLPDLAITQPKNTQLFFVRLWEVVFPEQGPTTLDVSAVTEDNDVMQVNKLPGELR